VNAVDQITLLLEISYWVFQDVARRLRPYFAQWFAGEAFVRRMTSVFGLNLQEPVIFVEVVWAAAVYRGIT